MKDFIGAALFFLVLIAVIILLVFEATKRQREKAIVHQGETIQGVVQDIRLTNWGNIASGRRYRVIIDGKIYEFNGQEYQQLQIGKEHILNWRYFKGLDGHKIVTKVTLKGGLK